MNIILKTINILPTSVIKKVGQRYDNLIVKKAVDKIISPIVGKGDIQRGPGRGLKIDSAGRKLGYILGTSDYSEQRFLSSNLQPGDVYYEIGANIGFFVLMAARQVGDSGHVYAFEPHPQAVDQLRKNVDLNGFKNVSVIESSAFDKDGTVKLDVGSDSGKSSVELRDDAEHVAQVDSLLLDTWSAEKPSPDAMKIDVEGSEVKVHHGSMKTIEECRPLLIVEVHRGGERFRETVSRKLQPLGYSATSLRGNDLPDKDGLRYHAILHP